MLFGFSKLELTLQLVCLLVVRLGYTCQYSEHYNMDCILYSDLI